MIKPITKGVVLAGGLGTRLHPLTQATNKHLLPVYDKPMIYYPLETLRKAGIEDVMIVTGGPHAGHFLPVIGNGESFGFSEIHYAYQASEGGIADALRLCEKFADGEEIVVILGDNIIQDDITPYVKAFARQERGARLLLKKVPDPERFGVAILEGRKIVKIIEKPKTSPSPYAVIGIYMYDPQVFDIIRTLKPSDRQELEITDVDNEYIRRGEVEYDILKGFWTDAGTFESLFRAAKLIERG